MKADIPTNVVSSEHYVLEIDGKMQSEYAFYIEALKAGLGFKQQFPHSETKVHEANQKIRTDLQSAA